MIKIKEINKPINIKKNIKFYINNDHYSDTFGKQWNKFSNTQIDTQYNNHSYIRFFHETGLQSKDFKNKNVLEVGSGAGRFTNVMLNHTEAEVYSVDSSNAVFANHKNNQKYVGKRLNLYQATIYDLPFEKKQFDIVICLGVIQHTPNIPHAITSLCNQVKKGGLIIIDFYPYNGFWTFISAKYILRTFTKYLSVEILYNFFKNKIKTLIKIYFFLEKNKLGLLNRFLPIIDISRTIPKNIDKNLLEEMVLLDVIDMLSPRYDNPQKIKKIKNLIANENFEIIFAGRLKYKNFSSTVVRGIRN